MSEVRKRLDRAAEDIIRAAGQLKEVERIMGLSQPGLRGTAYDGEGGGTVLWCEDHERPVAECHKRQDSEGHQLTCTGIPLPKKVDPTGDDALATRVWDDVRHAHRLARRLEQDAAWFVGMVNRWQDSDATPQAVAEVKAANLPRCERHLRYGYERDSRTQNGTRVKRKDGTFVFAEPHKLCEWCEDLARTEGRLATDVEIHANAAGKRRRMPA